MSQPPGAPDPYLPQQGSQPQPYQQPAAPQQPYPQPDLSGNSHDRPGRPSRAVPDDQPTSVVRLVQVMLAGAVLAVLSGAYLLVVLDTSMAEALPQMQQDPALEGVDTEALAGFTRSAVWVAVVLGSLVGAGLWALFAWLFGRGQGRVVGTVLGAVNGVVTVGGLFLTLDLIELLLQLLTLAVIVGAMVLLWLPATSTWFRAVKAADRSTSWT